MLSCLVAGLLTPLCFAEEASQTPLPPGMARADQPKEVAALHSVENQERAKALRQEPKRELTAQEEYQLKLIAYREQLVEEQRQRRIKELELEREREARQRAEQEALKAEIEKDRQERVMHLHAVQAYHRYIRYGNIWKSQHYNAHHPAPCSPPVVPVRPRCSSGINALIQVNID